MACSMVFCFLQGKAVSGEVATMLLGKHSYFVSAIENIAECHGSDTLYHVNIYTDEKNKVYAINVYMTKRHGIFITDTVMDCYLQPKDAWCQVTSNMINTESLQETKTTLYLDWVVPSPSKLETILVKCF